MPGRVEGKVAFITGAGRGQGRSHAVKLASEGADIIAIDILHDVEGALPMATPDDLAETVKLVETHDRRIIATQADVRDLDGLKAAVDAGVEELGRLDIVVANAGVASLGGPVEKMSQDNWKHTIDINLTGLWNTARVAIPHMIAGGPPDQREHPDVHERGHVQDVPPRPGEPDRGRRGADRRAVHARPAARLDRAGGRQQRGPLPGLRRVPLHHRRAPPHRPRRPPQVGLPNSPAYPGVSLQIAYRA
jgi:NAD(P)-dependent dehydrogenase (short-subunit alcohol dehydrogenase family)